MTGPTLLDAVTALIAITLLPGTFELLLLTVAGIFRPPRRKTLSAVSIETPGTNSHLFRLTVVVPAHNEDLLISRCVRSLLAADTEGMSVRVVVIADNCADHTAVRARQAGAEVIERFDAERRGKGPALAFAFDALRGPAAEAFTVVDADTEVDSNFFTETVAALRAGAAATQARYLVRAAAETPRNHLVRLVSAAYNVVRARGRAVLGFSAGIYGNGFALSAETLRAVPYTAHSIVEDIEYHLKLLEHNKRVVFLDQTAVHADLPESSGGAASQRVRWDGGRMRIAVQSLPRVAKQLLRGKWRFTEAALDLLLPPLAFYGLFMFVVCWAPKRNIREFGAGALLLLILHLCTAAFVAGRGFADLRALSAVPLFVVWKVMLVPQLLKSAFGRVEWIRTERTPGAVKR